MGSNMEQQLKCTPLILCLIIGTLYLTGTETHEHVDGYKPGKHTKYLLYYVRSIFKVDIKMQLLD